MARKKISILFATFLGVVLALWISAFYRVIRDFFGGPVETLVLTSVLLGLFIFGGYLKPETVLRRTG